MINPNMNGALTIGDGLDPSHEAAAIQNGAETLRKIRELSGAARRRLGEQTYEAALKSTDEEG